MISEFRDEIPPGTQVIITADHGELLGEDGSVGHNPNLDIKFHKKLHEVPFLQWVES
jgi:glucan phosphoethanolaminetransferase (alkaline phosphatase superfamily)